MLGSTSAEWTLADFGALCAAAVVTPIYHTNSPEECAYMLGHSAARLVFCEDVAQAAKIAEIHDRCPSLRHVVLFEGEAEGAITLAELRAYGTGRPARARARAARGDGARRHRDTRLHVGDDRATKGLHAQPLQLPPDDADDTSRSWA